MRVDELLDEQGIPYKPRGRDYLIRCLNPDHEDKNPSMSIDKISGIFSCFSCGFKGDIFRHFNKEQNYLQIRRDRLKTKIEELRASSVGLEFPTGWRPFAENWRDIKPSTYYDFDAFTHHDGRFAGRVIFPIRDIMGKVVGFNGRHRTLGQVPKYMIYPPQAVLPLFPAIVKPIRNRVLLVEGLFDMINLHDKNLKNAMCCFGVNKVTPEKLALLKMQGVTGIDIVFDGDDAGRRGAEKTKAMALENGFLAETYDLGDNRDPGSLSESEVRQLEEHIYIS